MSALLNADGQALLWIQSNVRAAWLTPIVVVITHLGDSGALWILLTVALLCFKKTRRIGIVCALSMALGLAVTNLFIKNAVARVRPYDQIEALERLVGAQKDWSFPSGHTTNGFACAWVLFRRAPKKYGIAALVVAALIALTRLYVGVHYPTDVLGGLIIGLVCAAIALCIDSAVARKRARQ